MSVDLAALLARIENAAREGDFDQFDLLTRDAEAALGQSSGSEATEARRQIAALRLKLVEHPTFVTENARLVEDLAEAEALGESGRARRLSEQLYRRGKTIMASMRQPEDEAEPLSGPLKALFAAIKAGDLDATRAHAAEADLNRRAGAMEETALGHALSVQGRSPEMVTLLLEAGADPANAMADGYSALHLVPAYPWGWEAPGTTALIADALVFAGGDIEAPSQSYHWTPLHRAVMEGTAQELEALLRAGADPNRLFDGASEPWFTPGRLPLQLAGHDTLKLKLLLEYGADPEAQDVEGRDTAEFLLSLIAEHFVRGSGQDGHRSGLEASLAALRSWNSRRN